MPLPQPSRMGRLSCCERGSFRDKNPSSHVGGIALTLKYSIKVAFISKATVKGCLTPFSLLEFA